MFKWGRYRIMRTLLGKLLKQSACKFWNFNGAGCVYAYVKRRKERSIVRLSKYKGKIVVGAILLCIFIVPAGALEFQYGWIQKTVYAYKVKHYLAETYNEPMVIKRVNYLWDNIEPISARVQPKSLSDLEFSVYPHEEAGSGFRDDYARTLWLHQAKEALGQRLTELNDDFRNQLYLDYACCTKASENRANAQASGGNVPSYTAANVAFDLSFQLNRELQRDDYEQMLHIVAALKSGEQPVIASLLFLLQPEGEAYRIQYNIPGASLKDIHTPADLKPYNESRFPARMLAAQIGASVVWDASKSQAMITKGETALQVSSWGESALVNGIPLAGALPSYLGDQGELLVPVAVIEEAFQVEISF
jgi:hypothetical protein